MSEKDYIRGNRAAWVELLRLSLKNLGYESKESGESAWIIERERAVSALRSVCEDHGDNDWPDDLDLSDVIEKHLAYHLDE